MSAMFCLSFVSSPSKTVVYVCDAYAKPVDEHTPLLDNHRTVAQISEDSDRNDRKSDTDTHSVSLQNGTTSKPATENFLTRVNSTVSRNESRDKDKNPPGGSRGQGHGSGQGQGQVRGQGRNADIGKTFGADGRGEVQFGAGTPSDDNGRVQPSLFRVLVTTYWVPFFVGQALMLLYTLLQFVNPMVLK